MDDKLLGYIGFGSFDGSKYFKSGFSDSYIAYAGIDEDEGYYLSLFSTIATLAVL